MVRFVNSNKGHFNGKWEVRYYLSPYHLSITNFHFEPNHWSTLGKEAYGIMTSLNKMAFYLPGAEVVIQSDHVPFQKLIKNKTKNVLTQNWALEIFYFTPHYLSAHKR